MLDLIISGAKSSGRVTGDEVDKLNSQIKGSLESKSVLRKHGNEVFKKPFPYMAGGIYSKALYKNNINLVKTIAQKEYASIDEYHLAFTKILTHNDISSYNKLDYIFLLLNEIKESKSLSFLDRCELVSTIVSNVNSAPDIDSHKLALIGSKIAFLNPGTPEETVQFLESNLFDFILYNIDGVKNRQKGDFSIEGLYYLSFKPERLTAIKKFDHIIDSLHDIICQDQKSTEAATAVNIISNLSVSSELFEKIHKNPNLINIANTINEVASNGPEPIKSSAKNALNNLELTGIPDYFKIRQGQ